MAMNPMSMAMTFSERKNPSLAPRQMASMELVVVRGTVAGALAAVSLFSVSGSRIFAIINAAGQFSTDAVSKWPAVLG